MCVCVCVCVCFLASTPLHVVQGGLCSFWGLLLRIIVSNSDMLQTFCMFWTNFRNACSEELVLVYGSWMQDSGPWMQGVGSRIQNARSRMQDPGCSMLDPGFTSRTPGSWMLNAGSQILNAGSQILDPGCRIQDHGSDPVHSIDLDLHVILLSPAKTLLRRQFSHRRFCDRC